MIGSDELTEDLIKATDSLAQSNHAEHIVDNEMLKLKTQVALVEQLERLNDTLLLLQQTVRNK